MEATCVVTTAHWNCYLFDGQAIFIPFWSSAYKGDKNHIIHYSHSRLFLFECSISSTSPPGTGAEFLQNHHREHPHKHDHDAVLKLLKQLSGRTYTVWWRLHTKRAPTTGRCLHHSSEEVDEQHHFRHVTPPLPFVSTFAIRPMIQINTILMQTD